MTTTIERIVRERQRERLARVVGRRRRPEGTTVRPSPWCHVPLGDLFGAHNTLYPRSNGLLECGHEPLHTSKGGRCVLVDPGAGRWWCRSCRQHGDAATFVMAVNGWAYTEAAGWLAAQYGRPAEHTAMPAYSPRRRRSRSRWRDL